MRRKSVLSIILILAVVISAVCMLQVLALAASEVTVYTGADLSEQSYVNEVTVINVAASCTMVNHIGTSNVKDLIIQGVTGDEVLTGIGAGKLVWPATGASITFKNLTFAGCLPINLDASTGTVIFENCTFDSCYNLGWGGAIYSSGACTVIIRECTFDNCQSWPISGVEGRGGAIAMTNASSTLEIYDSVFTGNIASYGGGAVYSHGSVTVTDSKFIDNGFYIDNGYVTAKASIGGAIFVYNNSVTVSGSKFTNNEVNEHGGAIYADNNINVTDSTFDENHATENGGAVCSTNGTITLDNCRFTSNYAGENGAIASTASSAANPITISNSYIGNNNIGSTIHPMDENAFVDCYFVETVGVSAGTKVTVNIVPAEGYQLDYAAVCDADGNLYVLTYKGNNNYETIVPEGEDVDLTIKTTFKPIRTCGYEMFYDIVETDSYHDAVDFVVSRKIMQGTSETTFDPDALTSRAMIVTTLYRMAGSPNVAGENKFADVAEGEWYTNAIIWAQNAGIVQGYSEDTFGTNDLITREQLATILYRYAKYIKRDVSEQGILIGFANTEKTGEYSQDAIKWCVGAEIITGNASNPVDLLSNISRAELAVFLQSFEQN